MPMLRLTVASPGAKPPPFRGDDPTVCTEQLAGGTTQVFYQDRPEHGARWIHLPDQASFRLGPGRDEVTAFAAPGTAAQRLHELFREFVQPMALQALGAEVLHASAVAMPSGLVAFCAEGGTGKSTFAYAL